MAKDAEAATQMHSETTETTSDGFISGLTGRFGRLVGGASTATIVSSSVFALIIGGVAAWMFLNLFGLAPLAFIVALALGWRHLMHEGNGWLTTGKGLYILAVQFVFLAPMFYIPVLFRSSTGEGAAAAGTFIGSFLGVIIWGFIFAIIAVMLVIVGYLLRRKGGRRLRTTEPAEEVQ